MPSQASLASFLYNSVQCTVIPGNPGGPGDPGMLEAGFIYSRKPWEAEALEGGGDVPRKVFFVVHGSSP